MTAIIDLIIVAIIALCIWKGLRAGLINGICGLLALAIAMYGGSIASKAYSSGFTGMLEPFMNGIVDGAAEKVLTWDGNAPADDENPPPAVILTEEEREDPYAVARAVYYELGITGSVADAMAAETNEAVGGIMGTEVMADITERFCARVLHVLVFYIGFALIAIVFFAIGNIFDLAFGIPGFENLNHIIGAVLGLVKGIAIVMVLACVFRYTGLLIDKETVASTWLLEIFVENNMAANILGI